ncbi:MAG: CAP domain-containing protein [Pseudomonadota bacterium]|nr:CAP domain-containing protein [Pseudomonadota bacterium]
MLLILIITAASVPAGVFEPTDLEQGYIYLNQIRAQAGMTPFVRDTQLETAAQNHAHYLADNFISGGHFEHEDRPGFTGVEPNDRTAHVGYDSLLITENVSSGDNSSKGSIDGLMGAIYHRLAFLDFINNEIGIGIAKTSLTDDKAHSAYVYNMGHSDYNALCQGPGFSGTGQFYTQVCVSGTHLPAADFEQVAFRAQGENPIIVTWPVGDDIPPAFFEENPDPLPDYSVSGYPLSIQFNPLSFSEAVEVTSFKLYRQQDNLEIQPTRLLTQETDPNGKLSPREFALFPLARLAWNTAYRAEVNYRDQDTTDTVTWTFNTRDLGVPLYTLTGSNETLSLASPSVVAVYVPPSNGLDKIGNINYSFSGGMTVETEFEDGNTLYINLSGQVGQRAQFRFAGNRKFTIEIIDMPDDVQSVEGSESTDYPQLGESYSVNALGMPVAVATVFEGGIAVNNSGYQKQVIQDLSDHVDIAGVIHVDPHHVGQTAELFVYAEAILPPSPEIYYFMLGENLTISLWDQSPTTLMAFKEDIQLQARQPVSLYTGQFIYPGTLKVNYGYRLADGTLVNSGDSIDISIQD